jgi:purine-binding chemotaxis protein CheW
MSEINQYLIFLLDHNLYGLPIANITEIIEYQTPTKIPSLPIYIHGLLNLRGKVLPIIDLNLYLGQNNTAIFKKTSALIINYLFKNQVINLGILVDEVVDVVEINQESLENVLDFNIKIKPEFVKNMVILDGKIVVLLDINQVFSEKALNIIADIPKN